VGPTGEDSNATAPTGHGPDGNGAPRPIGDARRARFGPWGAAPAAILTLVVLVDAIDQGIVPGVLPLLQDDWGFSDLWAGAIPTAALVIGFVALVPAGWMADHLVRVRVLAVVVASWAVLTTASGLATAFWMFFVVRMVLGAAAHVDNPVSSALIADYYPPRLRGRVFAVQRLAFVVGTGIGILIGGAVGEAFGWRWAFLVMVIPGLAVAGACLTLREPRRGALDVEAPSTLAAPAEGPTALLEEIELDAERPERAGGAAEYLRQFVEVLRIPTFRSIAVGVTVTFLGFNGIAFWLPTFFERNHDLSEAGAGAITALVAVGAGLVGTGLGGALGDRREARHPGGRVELTFATQLVGTVFLAVGFAVPSLGVMVVAVLVGATLFSIGFPNLAAATADVLPAHRRGTGFAMFAFLLTLGSALGPLVVGAASEVSGSLTAAIVIAVLPALPGAFVLRRAVRTFAADAAAARDAGSRD
jgi:MFS family permease